MIKNRKTRTINNKTIFAIFITIILILIISFYGFYSSRINKLQNELEEKEKEIIEVEKFNKYYSNGLTEYSISDFDRYNADYNYDLWGWYYEQGYFIESIEYCEAARELYSSSNAHYGKAKSYFEEADKIAKSKYLEIIKNYIRVAELAIEINWAMYEACEYFESASSYYNQGLYELGDAELEIGNEKITLHDSLVTTFNSYVSKIEVLEEEI